MKKKKNPQGAKTSGNSQGKQLEANILAQEPERPGLSDQIRFSCAQFVHDTRSQNSSNTGNRTKNTQNKSIRLDKSLN